MAAIVNLGRETFHTLCYPGAFGRSPTRACQEEISGKSKLKLRIAAPEYTGGGFRAQTPNRKTLREFGAWKLRPPGEYD